MKKVYTLGLYARIWDSLRNRYNINPAQFRTEEELYAFLRAQNDRLAKAVGKLDFWKKTSHLFRVRVTYVKNGKLISYARTHSKFTPAIEKEILRLKDKTAKEIAEFVDRKFDKAFTVSSIRMKRWRLLKKFK